MSSCYKSCVANFATFFYNLFFSFIGIFSVCHWCFPLVIRVYHFQTFSPILLGGYIGITFLADYTINENWYATGGIGYHQGTKTTDLNGYVYDTAIPGLNPNTSVKPGENEYDLDNGISLRAGVGYNRSFAKNWGFNAQLDYLYIELDDEQQGNIYSNGFAYTAGLTSSF